MRMVIVIHTYKHKFSTTGNSYELYTDMPTFLGWYLLPKQPGDFTFASGALKLPYTTTTATTTIYLHVLAQHTYTYINTHLILFKELAFDSKKRKFKNQLSATENV